MAKHAQQRDTYHHGSLPSALIAEGAALLAKNGVDGFSMREVARRAGVAVAAPSHHFGNAKGLLTAIAAEGFAKLATQMEAAAACAVQPEDQVIAMCGAYVEMGSRNGGHAAIMFRLDLLDTEDEQFRHQSLGAFDLLGNAVQKAAPRGIDKDRANQAAKTLWAAMHGLVALKMIDDREAEDITRFAVTTLLAGLHQG